VTQHIIFHIHHISFIFGGPTPVELLVWVFFLCLGPNIYIVLHKIQVCTMVLYTFISNMKFKGFSSTSLKEWHLATSGIIKE